MSSVHSYLKLPLFSCFEFSNFVSDHRGTVLWTWMLVHPTSPSCSLDTSFFFFSLPLPLRLASPTPSTVWWYPHLFASFLHPALCTTAWICFNFQINLTITSTPQYSTGSLGKRSLNCSSHRTPQLRPGGDGEKPWWWWRWSPSPSSALSLFHLWQVTYQNQHIMGWGGGNPEPSPGEWEIFSFFITFDDIWWWIE